MTPNDKGATNVANDFPAALLPARWYVVTNYGAATLCLDEADARTVARQCDREWPKNAPHVAVQLVPAASESRGSVPDGWVLVPREATPEMLAAGSREVDWYSQNAADCYSAMLAAAPTPPAVASGEPTAEEWRTLVDELATDLENEIENRRASELPRRIERDLEIVREARRMLARSAAAKGEG